MRRRVIRPPFNIIRARPPGLVLDRRPDGLIGIHGLVVAVLQDAVTGEVQDVRESKNLVTDSGDLYYAMRGADEQPTDALFTDGATSTFDGIMELYTGVTASPSKGAVRSSLTAGSLVTGSAKVMDSGFPKTNDVTATNTGAGTDVVTYRVSYLTSEANATNIKDVIITNPSPSAGDNILLWSLFSGGQFTKTSASTLTVFCNHTLNGA